MDKIVKLYQMDSEQRERYLTIRIVEIRKDGIVGDTFAGPIGAVEIFNNNRDCDVTVLDPRRNPWWNRSMSSARKPTRRTRSGEAKRSCPTP
jgi:hypothetical protein